MGAHDVLVEAASGGEVVILHLSVLSRPRVGGAQPVLAASGHPRRGQVVGVAAALRVVLLLRT